jgi:hypothetical protein
MGNRNLKAVTKPKKVRRNWSRIIFLIFGALMAILFILQMVLPEYAN